MRSSTFNNNFTAGELTPLMYGRSELEPYQKGLAECLNMRVLRHGGATRREGTRYVGSVKSPSKATRLIPFVFSENDSLVLEVGDQYIRFWDEGGQLQGGVDYIANGTFDTSVASWSDASAGTSSMTWDSLSQSMLMWSNTTDEAIGRQTITGLTTGVNHTFKFDSLDATASRDAVRVGTTLGASDVLNSGIISGTNSFTINPSVATLYIEFITTGIPVVPSLLNVDNVSFTNATTPLELATPYLESEIKELMYAQSADVMWITHRNHPPNELRRTAPLTFTIASAIIKQGPFANAFHNSVDMTINTGSTWGIGITGTLDASGAYFAASDQGEYAVVYDQDDISVFAVVRLDTFVSSTQMSAFFVTAIPTGLQGSAHETWALQAIGDRHGYPSAVTLHDQRLVYGGTDSQPQNVFGSTVGDFNTFSLGIDDDDHYNYELASTKQSEINFIAVRHDMVIGTISNEWAMRGGGLEDPITPSNVVTRAHRSEGSIRVQPEEANDILVFVQRAGHKLIGLAYSDDTRKIQTSDMGLLAEHLTNSSIIRQLSYKSERESIIWAVTDIGQFLGITYDASQDILAWHQHTTGANGLFKSVATIPAVVSDRTWVIVERTINGSTVQGIEYIEDKDWRIDDDPYYVDSGITYSGPATSTITGLDHLEAQTVEVYSSGEYVGDYLVASGQITLDKDAIYCHVGLGYDSHITELPEGSNSQDGSGHTRQKRKPVVDVRLYRTQGIKVNGDTRNLPRDASTVKPELFSGIIETTKLGWDKDAQNTISSIGPNPLTVLAIRSTLNMGQE